MGNAECSCETQATERGGEKRVRAGPTWTYEPGQAAVWGKLEERPRASPSALPPPAAAKPNGVLGRCCNVRLPHDLDLTEREPEGEEVIDPRQIKTAGLTRTKIRATEGVVDSSDVTFNALDVERGQVCGGPYPGPGQGMKAKAIRWELWRPIIMGITMILTLLVSSFAEAFLPSSSDDQHPQGPSLESLLRYGSIPVVAAIIGYGTNVVALQMMFYPLEFMGCFPNLKIGCGLDLPLCGWQGVIPMKAVEMATISVDLMTQKLIKVEEIFSRLDPDRVSEEVAAMLPEVVSAVITEAGRRHCPKLWEHLPIRVRKQLEDSVSAASKPMMSSFIEDLQRNISTVFDLKACVVDVMVADRRILNDTFLLCGAEEFKFIRVSGYYLGFFFGLFQMMVWMFVKRWWILPLCGVFVGYLTNVVALKVIFLPVEPRKFCGIEVQGLFLQRQEDVSALYAKQCADKILAAEVLMRALVNGPSSDKMFELVDKHVAACVEEQAGYYKPMFLMSIGSETWADFRGGVCSEFRKKLPALLTKIQSYAQETLQLEGTIRSRLQRLPPKEFERLLHSVFEQDEIKLILVGALLGAIVGFLQAVVQTPEQLGLGR